MSIQFMKEKLVDRFCRYVSISSQSDAKSTSLPSTEGQREFARYLAQELLSFGLNDVNIDQNGILTARLKGNCPNAPTIGWVVHLDTVDVGLSPDIHPQLRYFDGHDICLNAKENIWLRVEDHPEILPYKGDDILLSDGTSVLGADNKAAVTIVMTLLDQLLNHPTQHSDIVVAFVPDEEIGLRGAKAMDLTQFPVDFAFTIDCCEKGEVVYETFNAATVTIDITGVTAHPMSAKNVLVNPIRVAHDLISCFDKCDTPEHTEGREGYFWVTDCQANPNHATVTIHIRDFDDRSFEERKRYIQEAVALIQSRYPKATLSCKIEDVYRNIASSLGSDRRSIDLIFKALDELRIQPKVIPMRGGTDGSALSARGIPTPNYFTGAHNFHSRFEFLPVSAFYESYLVTEKICQLASKL